MHMIDKHEIELANLRQSHESEILFLKTQILEIHKLI